MSDQLLIKRSDNARKWNFRCSNNFNRLFGIFAIIPRVTKPSPLYYGEFTLTAFGKIYFFWPSQRKNRTEN